MTVPLLTPLFRKISDFRELSAKASMLGACQTGHDIIGITRTHERRIISFMDQFASTDPQDKKLLQMLEQLPRYFKNYIVTNSPLSALDLAHRLYQRTQDGIFLPRLFHKDSTNLLRDRLVELIDELANSIEVRNEEERLAVITVLDDVIDRQNKRKTHLDPDNVQSIQRCSEKLSLPNSRCNSLKQDAL